MILATVLAAGWINRRFLKGETPLIMFYTGFIALVILFGAELGLGSMQGKTLVEVVADRDPVSGTAYYASLVLFALMPWLLDRLSPRG